MCSHRMLLAPIASPGLGLNAHDRRRLTDICFRSKQDSRTSPAVDSWPL
jgi:hypothetical protein